VHALEVHRPDDALRFMTEYLAHFPDSVVGHCQMALVLLELDRGKEAVLAAQRAASLDPLTEWPQRVLAHAYLSLGKKRQSLEAAKECVSLAPSLPLAHYTLGQSLLANGKVKEALESAERLRTLAPNDFYAHFMLGRVALARRKWLDAEGHFEASLKLDPTSSAALNNLGVALERQGKQRDAIDRMHDAARTSPSDKLFRENLDKSVGRYVGGGLSMLFVGIWLARGLIQSVSHNLGQSGGNAPGRATTLVVWFGVLSALFLIGFAIVRYLQKRRRLGELHGTVAGFYLDNRRRERRELPLQIAFIAVVPVALVWSMFVVAGIGRPGSLVSGLAFAAVLAAAIVIGTIVIRRALAKKRAG
jgi:tetratricopeptide (TPR) repeat protein